VRDSILRTPSPLLTKYRPVASPPARNWRRSTKAVWKSRSLSLRPAATLFRRSVCSRHPLLSGSDRPRSLAALSIAHVLRGNLFDSDQLAVWLKALMESSKNGGGILAMKSILVPTSGSDTDEPVFATALAAAQPFSAHLRFVHVRVSAGRAALHTPHVEFARGPSVVDWKSCSWRLTRGQLRRDSISANFAHIPELRWWTCPAPRTW